MGAAQQQCDSSLLSRSMDDVIQRIRGIRLQDEENGDPQPKPKVLEDVSLAGIVQHIQKITSSDDSTEHRLVFACHNWLFVVLFQPKR